MNKRLYTEQDIRAIAARGEKTFVIGKDDIVTPLARDAAQQARLRIVRATDADPPAAHAVGSGGLTAPVPVGTESGRTAHSEKRERAAAATRIDGRAVELQPFPFDVGSPHMDVRAEDVVTSKHGSPMGAGFLSFRKGSFPWKLTYDEVQYVIEGELHIVMREKTLIGRPGDVLFVPKGSEIEFATPSWVKLLYVTYPADWA